jgi:hypothetical protein
LVHILGLAFVRVELLLDSGLRFRLPAQGMMCWKLHIAELADSQYWNVIGAPDDPKFSLCHGQPFCAAAWSTSSRTCSVSRTACFRLAWDTGVVLPVVV